MDWQVVNLINDFDPGVHNTQHYENSWHIPVSGNQILTTRENQTLRPLTRDEWRWSGVSSNKTHFLGTVQNNAPIFAEDIEVDLLEPEGYRLNSLWNFLTGTELPIFYLVGRAKQVVDWSIQHKYCGACGSKTLESTTDRSKKCPHCNIPFYPRISPSIIVLVTRGEELLLAKNANAQGNFYSTLAGFVEPGESIEETVHREVFEEVGIKIKNLKYFASQSWPFPNSLMLGFHAEYSNGEIRIQEEEIADARWFHYKEMPNKPAMMSISGWLIDDYLKKLGS